MNSKTVTSPMEKNLNLTKNSEKDPKLPYRQFIAWTTVVDRSLYEA